MLHQSLIWNSSNSTIDEILTAQKLSEVSSLDRWEHQPSEAASISIQIAQDLNSWLALKPFESAAKVAVIWQAEKLTLEAQNCLLKSLEEPPNSSLIILVTTEPLKLLPTILSRCRVEQSTKAKSLQDHELTSAIEQWNKADYLGKLSLIQTWLKDRKRNWFSQLSIGLLESETSRIGERAASTEELNLEHLTLLKQIYIGLEHNANLQPTLETLALCW